jgi:DNA-binding response OmpR family regulator
VNKAVKTILVVDDEVKIVEVVTSYLERDGYAVIEAYNGKDALDLFDKANPSLVVLDLMLPDFSGEDVCRRIRKKSRVPIIMLTAKVEEGDVLQGLGIGADDYVTKPFSPRELMARVAAMLRRSDVEPYPLANSLSFNNDDLVIDNLRHEVRKKGVAVNLTPHEHNILMTMAAFPTKSFSREELINSVIDDDYEGFARTIDTHIKNIRHKIETDMKDPKYILTIHGIGYKFGGESP